MKGLTKKDGLFSLTPAGAPNKVETYAGKYTARVTKTHVNKDGSILKATRKINKDGSISDKIEHRHW